MKYGQSDHKPPDVPGMRDRLTLVAITVAAVAAVVAVATLGLAESHGRPGLRTSTTGFAGALPPALPFRQIALRDQDGRLVRLSDEHGRVTVLTFMFSTCHDTCPLMAQQIRGALDQLGHDVPVLAVTVDPTHDTRATAKRFVNRQYMTGRMRFLLGTKRQLRPIWKAYAVQPTTPESDHSVYVFVLDRRGIQRVDFPADHLTPEGLEHDIHKLEGETRRQ